MPYPLAWTKKSINTGDEQKRTNVVTLYLEIIEIL